MPRRIVVLHRHGAPEHALRNRVVPDLGQPKRQDKNFRTEEDLLRFEPNFLAQAVFGRIVPVPQVRGRGPVFKRPAKLLQNRMHIDEAFSHRRHINIFGPFFRCIESDLAQMSAYVLGKTRAESRHLRVFVDKGRARRPAFQDEAAYEIVEIVVRAIRIEVAGFAAKERRPVDFRRFSCRRCCYDLLKSGMKKTVNGHGRKYSFGVGSSLHCAAVKKDRFDAGRCHIRRRRGGLSSLGRVSSRRCRPGMHRAVFHCFPSIAP